jgi:hypothetical protein
VTPAHGSGWPDHFDIRTDPVFQDAIQPFINGQLTLLKNYDAKRIERQQADPENIPVIAYKFYDHALRVADDVADTCAALGLPENVRENMRAAMLVHDIGKHTLDIEKWDSKDKPDDALHRERRSHTGRGTEIVKAHFSDLRHPFIDLMLDIINHHHDPVSDHQSMPVRLTAIVESYDGYRIARPHFGDRDISPRAVLEKMRSEPGKGAALFDMNLFETFAAVKLRSSPVKYPDTHQDRTRS